MSVSSSKFGYGGKIEKQDMEKEVKIVNHSHPSVVSWLTKRLGKNDLQLTLEGTVEVEFFHE